ncbi:MAG: MlaD family protein [Candidatus Adiutrix sp.]|jgi:ABC-type transporter Mla subunit MlaD|nr:MlaD family protein [Candidatus Adiutrix sp.]
MPGSNYFKIGMFTFAGLALFLAGLFFFGLSGSLFKERLNCVTFYNRSVQGLSVDSAVKFRGFNVGSVTSIALDSVEESTSHPVVRVGFAIDPQKLSGREEPVETAKDYIIGQTGQGLRAVLSFQGITGMAFLDLDYTPRPKYEPEFESLRQRLASSDQLVYVPSGPGQIMEISESATRIVKSLSDVDFADLSRDLKTLLQAVDQAVIELNTAKLSTDISGAMNEVRQMARNLDETIQGGADSNLGREIESSVAQLRQSLRRFDQLLGSSQGNLPATLDNLRVMSENFREMSELIKAQPSQAIFGQPPRSARPDSGK